MNPVKIIEKTRDGMYLTKEEIHYMVCEYTSGNIPDYQVSAWLMAIYFKGLSKRETGILTEEMANSGERLNFIEEGKHFLDKHSTGGVADTTTLVVAPIVAAAGGKVGKMSGRGLGFTGGTLDKMEAIPGLQIRLSEDAFRRQVDRCGVAVIGQSRNLAPADGLLYALRDVTGTVESLPLIASSVMSKKLASGAKGIVLDVKCGKAAFMKNIGQAEQLAELMVEIGRRSNRNMFAFVSDMNIPLGSAIGNSLEVDEAVEVLSGGGNERLKEMCFRLAGAMLYIDDLVKSPEDGFRQAMAVVNSGAAMERFKDWLSAQGGTTDWIGRETLTKPINTLDIYAAETGYLQYIEPLELAHIAMELGAGRKRKEDQIDLQVGVKILVQCGEHIKKGMPLVRLYGKDGENLEEYALRAENAFIVAHQYKKMPLLYKIIS